LAEAEILADDDMRRLNAVLENIFDEIFGALAGEIPVEGERIKYFTPASSCRQALTAGGVRRPGGSSGRNSLLGCGSKVRTASFFFSFGLCPALFAQQGLMALMNAIEIADNATTAPRGL
jgi:hypothetical protein